MADPLTLALTVMSVLIAFSYATVIAIFGILARNEVHIKLGIISMIYTLSIITNLLLISPPPGVNPKTVTQFAMIGDMCGSLTLILLLMLLDRHYYGILVKSSVTFSFLFMSGSIGLLAVAMVSQDFSVVGTLYVNGEYIQYRHPIYNLILSLGAILFIVAFAGLELERRKIKDIVETVNAERRFFTILGLYLSLIVLTRFVLATISQSLDTAFIASELINTIAYISVTIYMVFTASFFYLEKTNIKHLLSKGHYGWIIFDYDLAVPKVIVYSHKFVDVQQLQDVAFISLRANLMTLFVPNKEAYDLLPLLTFPFPNRQYWTVVATPLQVLAEDNRCLKNLVVALTVPTIILSTVHKPKGMRETFYSEISTMKELKRAHNHGRLMDTLAKMLNNLF